MTKERYSRSKPRRSSAWNGSTRRLITALVLREKERQQKRGDLDLRSATLFKMVNTKTGHTRSQDKPSYGNREISKELNQKNNHLP